jgi:hypothetical protein
MAWFKDRDAGSARRLTVDVVPSGGS